MRLQHYCVFLIILLFVPFSHAQGVPAQIDAALADLSNRVGQTVTLSNNTLSNWQWAQEEFSDAGLGCPQPGNTYAQVITPGYIFTLTYQGTIYDYRVSLDGTQVILCEQRSTDAPTPQPTLEEQYSNPLCQAPTDTTGPYPRSRVNIGTLATGTLTTNRLREQPSTTAALITEIPNEAVFIIAAGPQCDDEGIVWWQVDFDGVLGWTAEAQAAERFIEPRLPDALPQLATLTPEASTNISVIARLQGNLLDAITISPNGETLAMLGASGSDAVVLYNLNDLTAQPRYIDGDATFLDLDFHPNGGQVLLGDAGGGVRLWNLLPDAPLLESLFLQTHIADVDIVAMTPDGQRFASAGVQALTTGSNNPANAILLWDLQTVTQVAVFDAATTTIAALAFAPDGTRISATTTSGDLFVWPTDAPQAPSFQALDSVASAIAYSPNGQFLAVGRADGAVDLLDGMTNDLIVTYTGHLGTVNAVSFSPDNRLLASAAADGTVRLWDTQADASIATLDVNRGQAVTSLQFTPTGNLIIAATDDGTLNLLGIATDA